jgi:hypothetical protein
MSVRAEFPATTSTAGFGAAEQIGQRQSSGHLQRADPFRTANLSESVRLGRIPDRKGLSSGLCSFGSGGVPSGVTHFLGRDGLDWRLRQDGCLSVYADYYFGQFDKGNIFTN